MASGTDGSDFFTTLSNLARTQIKGLSAMWGIALDQLTTNHAKAAAAWTSIRKAASHAPPTAWVVTSKELVMQVFLNTDENYSVKGYNERASKSIGPIYLGLDWGPEYEHNRQRQTPLSWRSPGARHSKSP